MLVAYEPLAGPARAWSCVDRAGPHVSHRTEGVPTAVQDPFLWMRAASAPALKQLEHARELEAGTEQAEQDFKRLTEELPLSRRDRAITGHAIKRTSIVFLDLDFVMNRRYMLG